MQTWIHVLEWRATCDTDLVAVRDDREQLTYGELLTRVEERAGGWAERGIGSGDVVAILAHNGVELLAQSLGLQRLGALPLLLNWRMTAHEVGELLGIAGPRGVFADAACRDLVDPRLAAELVAVTDTPGTPGWDCAAELVGPAPERPVDRLRSREPAFLMHTSGTTGRPKLIPLDHGSLISTLSGFAIDIGDQVRGSRHLVMMPLFHLAGYAQAMQAFLTGGSLTLHDGVDIERAVATIAEDRIEFFTAAPTIIEMFVDALEGPLHGADVSSLKEIQYGAAPIDPDLLTRAVRVICPRFRQIYGSTELQGFLSVLRPEDHVPGSERLATAGQVALGWEARVCSPDGEMLPSGATGELQIRGEAIIEAYWRDPEATARAWTADGWYRTGDLAVLLPGRYLRIVGRANDMIISGGENIYPAEVERVLHLHEAVVEAAVVGRPHPKWGETPVAWVVLDGRTTVTPDELIAHCRTRLAAFKCPTEVRIIEALPRNALGKVVKTSLREPAAKAQA